jgi:hypothetical protein
MKWLADAIANYDNLNESEKVQVDAALDHFENQNHQNDDQCVCGETNCADEYAHVTSGY